MASAKLSALVDLAGGQVPGDLAYVVDVSAGAAGSKKSSLNDLFATITKNITDLSVQFQNGAGTITVSAVGQGKLAYNNAALAFQASINGGAYVNVATVAGSNTQVQFNNNGVLGGAAGLTYQNANPTVTATAQANNQVALSVVSAVVDPTVSTFTVQNSDGSSIFEINPGDNLTTQTFEKMSFKRDGSVQLGLWAAAGAGAVAGMTAFTTVVGNDFLNVYHNANGAADSNLLSQSLSGVFYVNSVGGVAIVAGDATGVIRLGTGGIANSNERVRIDAAGLVGINKTSSIGAQTQIVANGNTTVGLIVDSAAAPTADIFQARQNASATAAFAVKPDGMFTYPGLQISTADFSVTSSTTFAAITGCTVNVRAGRTYAFRAIANATCGASAGGVNFRINGTATATFTEWTGILYNETAEAVLFVARNTALTGTLGDVSTITSYFVVIEGVIVVNAAGTLEFQFAQGSSNVTPSVARRGAIWQVTEEQ